MFKGMDMYYIVVVLLSLSNRFVYTFFIMLTLYALMNFSSWFNCWIFISSGIQLYVLLSHYLIFVSFLYLHLYVLDDASISYGAFMRIEHLCVLIHIRI